MYGCLFYFVQYQNHIRHGSGYINAMAFGFLSCGSQKISLPLLFNTSIITSL